MRQDLEVPYNELRECFHSGYYLSRVSKEKTKEETIIYDENKKHVRKKIK